MPTTNQAPGADSGEVRLTWRFRLDADAPEDWSWASRGAPPVERLKPVRKPRSSKRHRHIPPHAYSTTICDFLWLESGLEHDLVRRLDRDPLITRIVAQPLRLSWTGAIGGGHIPDLLTVEAGNLVTIWDVRPAERQEDKFALKSRITRDACAKVGWRYEVFAGLHPIERLNLLWLNGFRQRPAWADRVVADIRRAADRPGVTLGDLFAEDDGTGELKSTVWHMLWHGDLATDMTIAWGLDTIVGLADVPPQDV